MTNKTENLTCDDRRVPPSRAAAVGLCVLGMLLATSPILPMVWDEGNAIGRAERIGDWGRAWFEQGPPDRPHPMSREGIAADWPYTTQIEGHPAFYGTVIAAGHGLGHFGIEPLSAWRLGPMILFALAGAAMFWRLGREYGQAAGLAAVVALVLQPRLFAHAHFALCDGTLTACWVAAWAAFEPRRGGWKKAVLFGILLGMTMSTKATGWIAPIPFMLWTVVYWDRRTARFLAIGLPAAMATFYMLNPPLWHDPIGGLVTFFHLNSHRDLNVANFFLGRMYDLDHPLPWYNTLVWTAVAVPVGLLLLMVVGLGTILRRGLGDRVGVLLLLNWAVLLVVRALPGTPPHDGIRLFVPAFAFLAGLVGIGTASVLSSSVWETIVGKARGVWAARAFVALVFLGSATSLFWYAPQWLSYYNLAIGGLPGATRAGMEPTYYWDSLDGEVLDWLAANTAEGEKVYFGSSSPESLALMRQWGTLPVEYASEAPGRYRWYVIQRRPSACMSPDQWLLTNATPVYKKYVHRHGRGPWAMNVPLLEVYEFEDYAAAVEATAGR